MEIHGMRSWEQDCFIVVRLWATWRDPETGKTRELLADLSFEIDGRDFEYDPLWESDPSDFCTGDLCDALFTHDRWPEIEKAMQVAAGNH
jgi:hypothetical protein